MKPDHHDVLVLGAGPAGAAAAIALQQHQRNVVLVDRTPLRDLASPRPEWISAAGVALLKQLQVDSGSFVGTPFTGITFHDTGFDKMSASEMDEPPGYRIDYVKLIAQLRKTAQAAGATLIEDRAVKRIEYGERQVVGEATGGRTVVADFAILADGAEDRAVVPETPVKARWVLQATIDHAKPVKDATLHWHLDPASVEECFCWWFDGKQQEILFMATGEREALEKRMRRLLATAIERSAMPGRKKPDELTIHARPVPAKEALELDSHVDKRCLRVGDAGGFVNSLSGEGIYPAIWSAQLAVNSLHEAIDSDHPQDHLRQFSTHWRTTMADYLRPLHTDLHFLLPLIFTNRQMADRLANAFWTGSSI